MAPWSLFETFSGSFPPASLIQQNSNPQLKRQHESRFVVCTSVGDVLLRGAGAGGPHTNTWLARKKREGHTLRTGKTLSRNLV